MQDAIIMYENGKAIGGEGHPTDADDITFNNTGTDLVSENVEDAIKEVDAKVNDIGGATLLGTVSSTTTTATVNVGNYRFYLLCIVNGTDDSVLFGTYVPKALIDRVYCQSSSNARTYLIGTTLACQDMPNATWQGRLYGID